MYGLTEEEIEVLESDDDEFFGETRNRRSSVNESESELSEGEEIEEQGILDADHVDIRIQRATRNDGDDTTAPEESQAADNSSSTSPDSDPIYRAITRKLSAGCLCSGDCLSQFSAEEVYLFHLSLFEMTKVEKDMLLLGKLQVTSRVGDTIQHAGRAKPGKRQRVTCDYRFDHRHVCKDSFMFLHDIGTNESAKAPSRQWSCA